MTSASSADDDALALEAFDGRDSGVTPTPAPAVPTPEPAPQAREPAVPAAPETPAEPSHQVPVRELQAEREKRQHEKRLREDAEHNNRQLRDTAAQLQARLEAIERAQRQPPPDFQRDPRGAMNHELQRVAQTTEAARIDDRAHLSESMALDRYGPELVEKARAAAIQAGVAQHFYINSRDPYRDVVAWYKEQQVKAEIGTDLDGWKKKTEEAMRAKILAELQGGATPDGASPPRFPGSLANATNAGARGAMPVTDDNMLAQIFDPERQDRKMNGRG